MPRFVRNFWLQGDVDGLKKSIGTGPKHSGGGFNLSILVREEGDISSGRLEISGRCVQDPTTGVYHNILDVQLMNGGHVSKSIRLKVASDKGGTKIEDAKTLGITVEEHEEPKADPPKREGAFWEITDGNS